MCDYFDVFRYLFDCCVYFVFVYFVWVVEVEFDCVGFGIFDEW